MGTRMKHVLCGETFANVDAFNRHVGTTGHPNYHSRQPVCPYVVALRDAENRNASVPYLRPETGTVDARTGAGSGAVKRNAPGRKREHKNAAAKQRAYRRRRAGA